MALVVVSAKCDGPVLVVDDDDAIRESMCDLLADEGYPVLAARNGREALDVLHHEHPSLLVIDLTMPEMNGWQLIDAIHADAALSQIPVLVMTAASPDGADLPALRLLRKPLRAQTLLAVVAASCSHTAGP